MRKWIGMLLVILSLTSCDDGRVFDSYKTVNGGWDKEEAFMIEVTDLDSLQPLDVFITLRSNHEYPYNNLFLVTQLGYPNGKQEIDTLEYRMAKPSGELLGEGFGDVKEGKLWYKEGFRFRERGTYTMAIKQAMRKNGNIAGDEKLVGITEVGLRIERPENK
jgi:gliding motility-associated lipoprotein GldH